MEKLLTGEEPVCQPK